MYSRAPYSRSRYAANRLVPLFQVQIDYIGPIEAQGTTRFGRTFQVEMSSTAIQDATTPLEAQGTTRFGRTFQAEMMSLAVQDSPTSIEASVPTTQDSGAPLEAQGTTRFGRTFQAEILAGQKIDTLIALEGSAGTISPVLVWLIGLGSTAAISPVWRDPEVDLLAHILNLELMRYGETVRLLRMAKPPATGIVKEVSCAAVIRGYTPSDISPGSGIEQQDQLAILSPETIIEAAWPGVGLKPIPVRGDRLVTNRGVQTVQAAAGFYVDDVLVRIECQIRGM